jgi:hypothetical protein
MIRIRAATFLLLIFPLFLLGSCGLQYLVYLAPPTFVDYSAVGDTFTFKKTAANSELEFEGFELYYKLYAEQPSSADTNIEDQPTLVSRGFLRVSSPTDTVTLIAKPLIDVPLGAPVEVTFTVEFTPLDGIPKISSDSSALIPPIEIRRGVPYPYGSLDQYYFKRWVDASDTQLYVLTDADVSQAVLANIANDQDVNLVLYGLSYGVRDLSVDVYSEAVYLGTIPINYWTD